MASLVELVKNNKKDAIVWTLGLIGMGIGVLIPDALPSLIAVVIASLRLIGQYDNLVAKETLAVVKDLIEVGRRVEKQSRDQNQ